jgi:tRNA dimethylallyltransferase
LKLLVAIVGPTATGKSALALALARRFGGEIVACDSTAVYRGIDIGTDKLPPHQQQGIPHHMVDIVEPTETYSAARYAVDAAEAIRRISDGGLPVLAGGTGFYYRSLVRGLFPGPARDDRLRSRLDGVATRRGVESLHRWLTRVDAASAGRIQPRDRKRLIRALEVYIITGRPLTDHFSETVSPIPDYRVAAIGLTLPRPALRERVTRRVDAQFAAGVVEEVRGLLDRGVPARAHAFSGLVYRQIVELLQGVRPEEETRSLIVRENMHYARRQLVWFRKEPGVMWIEGAGESRQVQERAGALVESSIAASR